MVDSLPWGPASRFEELVAYGKETDGPTVAGPRLAQWKTLFRERPDAAAARVRALGISEPEFWNLLTGPPAACVLPPEVWVASFAEDGPHVEGAHEANVLRLVEPLIRRAVDHCLDLLEEHVWSRLGRPVELSTLPKHVLRTVPYPRIAPPVLRVLALEYELSGKKGSWHQFLKAVSQGEMRRSLWREYPGLIRYVTNALDSWVRETLTFVRALREDWELITDHPSLLGSDPGVLVDFDEPGELFRRSLGCVRICRFEKSVVVYKPRSLGAEGAFARVSTWLDQRSPSPLELRFPATLDCGDHGWTEYVGHDGTSKGGAEEFFRRAGFLTGCAHLMGALDIHAANVRACGSQPVLIDLETILTPALANAQHDSAGDQMELSSIVSTGLVPTVGLRRTSEGGYEAFDNAGFSDTAGRLTGAPFERITIGESGRPSVESSRRTMNDFHNLPHVNGQRQSLFGHRAMFLYGLRLALLTAAGSRDAMKVVVEDAFAGKVVRYIARPVRVHLELITRSLHPNLLRDERDRGVMLDKLWTDASTGEAAEEVTNAEWGSVANGLIPDFSHIADSRGLTLPTGGVLDDFWPESGVQRAVKRIVEMDEREVDRQLEIARQALASSEHSFPSSDQSSDRCILRSSHSPETVKSSDITQYQRSVLTYMMDHADERGHEIGWNTLEYVGNDVWHPRRAGIGLAQGLAGVGLCLAYCGRRLHDRRARYMATRVADGLCATVEREVEQGTLSRQFDNGAAGILLSLSLMTEILEEDRWLQHIDRLGNYCLLADYQVDNLDASLRKGVAGSVVALSVAADKIGASTLGEFSRARDSLRTLLINAAPASAGMLDGAAGVLLACTCLDAAFSSDRGDCTSTWSELPNGKAFIGLGTDCVQRPEGRGGRAVALLRALEAVPARSPHAASLRKALHNEERAIIRSHSKVESSYFQQCSVVSQFTSLNLLERVTDINGSSFAVSARDRRAEVVAWARLRGSPTTAPGGVAHVGLWWGLGGIGIGATANSCNDIDRQVLDLIGIVL